MNTNSSLESNESADYNSSMDYLSPVILGGVVLCAAMMGCCYYCHINRGPEVTMANAPFIMGDVT